MKNKTLLLNSLQEEQKNANAFVVVVCFFLKKEVMADSRKSLTPMVKQIGLHYNRNRIGKY